MRNQSLWVPAPPLLSQLPQLVAKKTGKPERYVPAEFWGWNGSTFG